MSDEVNVVQTGGYQVSGNRQGQVTVREITSSEVIRTFQMDERVVVREVFLLDGGRTVAACQKKHAVFWNLATGEELHRCQQRIYGFSHNETKFFTYKYPEGMFLYSYPDLRQICTLAKKRMPPGPFQFLFSPNDRFLVVWFANGYPSSDENYPRRNPVRSAYACAKLFNLDTCQEIQEFSQLRALEEGKFSPDSIFYDSQKTKRSLPDNNLVAKSWRFNLRTYEVRELSK
ncbi:hypothetical protein [Nostoc sp.]|uniref:hypothetical protein n=1 Tax=Nostoc sp. TaxID=1180 RepID=UPI002FFB94D7